MSFLFQRISNLESDIQSLNTQIQDVQRSLEEKEQANTDLTQRLYRSEQELEILKHDHLAAALQMSELIYSTNHHCFSSLDIQSSECILGPCINYNVWLTS